MACRTSSNLAPHQRFLANDLGSDFVVAAGVGDAAAKTPARSIKRNRLGRGGAEVNADQDLQALMRVTPATRFCSSICR